MARRVRSMMETLHPRPRKLRLLRWLPPQLVVSRASAADGAVYLTFDDGPHPEHTAPLLDVLARHGAKATFFLIGKLARRRPDLVRRIAAEGHSIGNHSQSHPEFRSLDLAAQLAEFDTAERTLRDIVGGIPIPLRTPRGALPPRLVAQLAAQGRPIVFWSYDSLDYRRGDPADVLAMMRDQPPRAGDIVLMHDDGPTAGVVLDALLPEWRTAGLRARALPIGLARP
jgi:peptidoglycan/xylan/chitin deacetylase (PgdA/CDA1 family)